MSGSNDPNRDDTSSQGGQPQGGQPQGGQPQGGQPQGGQPQGGQPQGGQPQAGQPQGGQPQGQYGQQPPQRGGTSVVDELQKPEPMAYLKGIVGTFAAGGVILSIMALLIGRVGGFSVLPSTVATFAGTPQVSEAISTAHATLLTYLSNELSPFIAFTLAAVFGVFVATRMGDDDTTKMATAAAGTAAGSFVFVLLVGLIAGITAPSASSSIAGPIGGSGGGGGSVSVGLGSPQFGPLIINSILVAIFAALTAAAVVYAIENLFPEPTAG